MAAALALTALLAGRRVGAQPARLPWPAGERVWVTQDCADSCCDDHVGANTFAWDFAAHRPFDVVAPRAGTVVHAKFTSNRGGDASQVDFANYLVLDHGDGTYSVMLHLAYNSLDPSVRCGSFVRAGQRLAVTGSTGWSSGNHLHYQVNAIPPGMNRTCECGADGMGCRPGEAHWELFWSHGPASATRPVEFEEWPSASACADRHDDQVLESRNVDAGEDVYALDDAGTLRAEAGAWAAAGGGLGGSYHWARAGTGARAFLGFERGAVRPGVYAIWNGVPAPAPGRTNGAWVEVVARGARVRVRQSLTAAGGAYRPVAGRYKFTGHAGEGLRIGDEGRAGEIVVVDGVTLVRVGDPGRVPEGGRCGSSLECEGDLVCGGGVCIPGCDVRACAPGHRCDATGLCVGAVMTVEAAPMGAPAPSVQRPPASWPGRPGARGEGRPVGGGPSPPRGSLVGILLAAGFVLGTRSGACVAKRLRARGF